MALVHDVYLELFQLFTSVFRPHFCVLGVQDCPCSLLVSQTRVVSLGLGLDDDVTGDVHVVTVPVRIRTWRFLDLLVDVRIVLAALQ